MGYEWSIIFNEIILFNNFSVEARNWLEVVYIPIFALLYNLELKGMQVLKYNLANRFR